MRTFEERQTGLVFRGFCVRRVELRFAQRAGALGREPDERLFDAAAHHAARKDVVGNRDGVAARVEAENAGETRVAHLVGDVHGPQFVAGLVRPRQELRLAEAARA